MDPKDNLDHSLVSDMPSRTGISFGHGNDELQKSVDSGPSQTSIHMLRRKMIKQGLLWLTVPIVCIVVGDALLGMGALSLLGLFIYVFPGFCLLPAGLIVGLITLYRAFGGGGYLKKMSEEQSAVGIGLGANNKVSDVTLGVIVTVCVIFLGLTYLTGELLKDSSAGIALLIPYLIIPFVIVVGVTAAIVLFSRRDNRKDGVNHEKN